VNDATYPRVTGVMRALNLIDDRWFSEEGRARGTAVHRALAYYEERDLDWASVDDTIKPFVEGGIRFLEDSQAIVDAVELEVVNERLRYIGHPDWLGTFFGYPTILDWKSGGIMLDPAGIQTAAYKLALGRALNAAGMPVPRRRIAVQLTQEGKYKLHDLDARPRGTLDQARWLAALDLFNTFIAPRNRRTHQQEEAHVVVA